MVVIALSALGVGVLIGYTQWGATASIVTLVERELAETQAHIKVLEKRMSTIETRIVGNDPGAAETGSEEVKKPDKKATRDRSKSEKEKQVWNSEPRF